MKYNHFQANITIKIKNVITFLKSKNVITFFIFLLLAFLLWLMHGTSTRSKLNYKVDITYIGIPEEVEFSKELPKFISVILKDEGKILWNYYINENKHINIDLTNKFNADGTINIDFKEYLSRLELQIESSTDIIEIFPDFYMEKYTKLESKIVPVYLKRPLTFANSVVLKDSILITPENIKISGEKNVIDSISHIYIKQTEQTISKSTTINNYLDIPSGIKVQDSTVCIYVEAEMSTEKRLQLPIKIVNLPNYLTIHTFPSVVQTSFNIGLSRYKTIYENDFEIIFDYNDILPSGDNEITINQLKIGHCPDNIYNLRISPEDVEYVIEENGEK